MNRQSVISPSLLDTFLSFEARHDLFAVRVHGHAFWDYMRYHVMNRLIKFRGDYIRSRSERYLRASIDLLSSLGYLASKPIKSGGPYDLIFFNPPGKAVLYNEKRVTMLTFPIVERLNSKYRILVLDPSEMNEDVERNYPLDILRSRPYRYWDKAKSIWTRYSRADREFFAGVQLKLKAEFGEDIDIYALAKDLYSFQLQEHRRYLRLFKRCRPKAVFYVDTGHMKPIVEAARVLGIASVELQHSLFTSLAVYCSYQECPPYPRAILPDYLFTYGDYWESQISLPIKRLSVGYPFLEIKAKLSSSNGHDAKKQKNIIIASGAYSKKEFIETALELADLLSDYTILYKLKPEHSRNFPNQLLERKRNIRIIGGESSIYDYLPRCSYQIGTNSSALYEGLYFGLITFVLKTGWYQDMKPLYDGGYAFLAASAQEIEEIVRKGLKPQKQIDGESLFKSNSLENMEKEIENIIHER